MNLDKVIRRFAGSPQDRTELRRLARALGTELSREHLDTLRSVRVALARLPIVSESGSAVDARSYATGYVASMLDVTAEYEACVRQSDDARVLEQIVMREGFRELLALLRAGPRLPSELAEALGEERSRITRLLQRLRAAGLVMVHDSDSRDGRQRPHRLTAEGRRVLDRLDVALSGDVARGIRLAVEVFRHLLANASSPTSALETIAIELLRDPVAAAHAVDVWASAARRAGLVASDSVRHSDRVPSPVQAMGSAPMGLHCDVLWNAAPFLLRQIEKRASDAVPVYVRTNDETWGAWAYALAQGHARQSSRTIVDGDIVSGSVQPPEQRFLLLYDHPAAIQADRHQPTMRAFLERAEQKYVVTGLSGDDAEIPEEFIPLEVVPFADPNEITAVG
jgi:DNA-binding MarR family transcriptional regulator